jgi:hypothetical protein
MTIDERNGLFEASLPIDPDDSRSRRYALRRSVSGVEFFDIEHTGTIEGDEEFHGHPASWVPARILRRFLDSGTLSRAEYEALVRTMGSKP